jgi:hypothetical protein
MRNCPTVAALIVFPTSEPTPASVSLFNVARAYVTESVRSDALGVCVCSSVAWGVATPVSDIDLQIIVPDGALPCREKRPFQDQFVDHFEWSRHEFAAATADWLQDPLRQPVGSYSLAQTLILLDTDGQLADLWAQLAARILQEPGAARWRSFLFDRAGEAIEKVQAAAQSARVEAAAESVWTGIEALAGAVLHSWPGGHCGAWPDRLQQWATAAGEPELFHDALLTVAPHGLDLEALAQAIRPLEAAHALSGTRPHGSGLGSPSVNAAYFSRKARYYAERVAPLALLCVLRRQIGYVESNLAAKEAAQVEAAEREEIGALHAHGATLLRAGRPWDDAAAEAALRKLSPFRDRIGRSLGLERSEGS